MNEGTRRKLPDEILSKIQVPTYLSTACQAAVLLDEVEPRTPEVAAWAERMHSMCRLFNKYTESPCICTHHEEGG